MTLFLAGCGSGTPSSSATTGATTPQVSAPPASATAKPDSKPRLKGTTPDGEMGVRERRSQKLKERAAAKS
jgi:hypothetical protein